MLGKICRLLPTFIFPFARAKEKGVFQHVTYLEIELVTMPSTIDYANFNGHNFNHRET